MAPLKTGFIIFFFLLILFSHSMCVALSIQTLSVHCLSKEYLEKNADDIIKGEVKNVSSVAISTMELGRIVNITNTTYNVKVNEVLKGNLLKNQIIPIIITRHNTFRIAGGLPPFTLPSDEQIGLYLTPIGDGNYSIYGGYGGIMGGICDFL